MGEHYEIIVAEEAKKKIKDFDKEFQRRFFNKIEKLKVAPDIYGKPLKYDFSGLWELRFEKRWRIIFKINENEKRVEIETVWHKDEF